MHIQRAKRKNLTRSLVKDLAKDLTFKFFAGFSVFNWESLSDLRQGSPF